MSSLRACMGGGGDSGPWQLAVEWLWAGWGSGDVVYEHEA